MNSENRKDVKNEFTDLEEIFKTFFKAVREDRKKDLNKDALIVCNITKQQAREGLVKNGEISVADVCGKCKGIGKKIGEQTKECENCYGTGFVYYKKNIVLKIPARVKNNDYIVFKRQGNKYNVHDERGDMYIKIHIYGNKSNRRGRKIYV